MEYLADFKGLIEAARVISALARLQWEYTRTDNLAHLAQLGLEGWELVTCSTDGWYMLKRPRIDTTPRLET